MKLIKELLFGRYAEPLEPTKLGFKSTYPPNRPNQWEWMKEYNVSILYGKTPKYLEVSN